ncbi:hypothetical protein [Pedobacter agri]|uniref:hypothetical protein n=1 Tax=Pedobacter agri TaxID=454586 RepID=UPI00292E93B2|nr:hypothetical protein [Pedobacter agri]
MSILLPILGLAFVVWAAIFIIYGETWQLPSAFMPVGVGAYIYFDAQPWNWLLLLPVLSISVFNVSAVLSHSKFRGWVSYLNYILILPVIVIYILNFRKIFADDSLLRTIFCGLLFLLMLIYISKFWLSDVILLLINKFYTNKCDNLETEITHRFIKGIGKTRTFHVTITALGAIETSGFFYWYIGLKKINPNDKVMIKLKTGCLGTEYIAGFPKIISRSPSNKKYL